MLRRTERGFTLIELLIVVAVVGIIAAIAAPGLLRSRMTSNEASAIGSLRTINSSQTSYASSCGKGGFATTLPDLYKAPVSGGTGFISPDLSLAPSLKSGYTVNMAKAPRANDVGTSADACNLPAAAPATAYIASADPQTAGGTGGRFFATDPRGTIFQHSVQMPLTSSIPSAAIPVQ